MRKILVTGGVGYVGRELLKQLVANGEEQLHVVDNLACGEHRLEKMDTNSFTLHVEDITDVKAIASLMDAVKPDLIFHLAAIHYIPLCENDPVNATRINVGGTVNLLSNAPVGSRFVLASSAAVYGPSNDAHCEDASIVEPMDIYGWNKLNAENYVSYYHQKKKVNGINVRLFNVVGSGETNPHLAPAIIEQLNEGELDIKLGNLFPKRDYINVKDVAHGFQALSVVSPKTDGSIICNLGSGKAHEVGEMVNSIASAAQKELNIIQDEKRIRSVDRPMLVASVDRLRDLTGWVPTISLSQSMAEAWSTRDEDKLVV